MSLVLAILTMLHILISYFTVVPYLQSSVQERRKKARKKLGSENGDTGGKELLLMFRNFHFGFPALLWIFLVRYRCISLVGESLGVLLFFGFSNKLQSLLIAEGFLFALQTRHAKV